jgi:hypothetical protein
MHNQPKPQEALPAQQEGLFYVDVRFGFDPDPEHPCLRSVETLRNTLPDDEHRHNTASFSFEEGGYIPSEDLYYAVVDPAPFDPSEIHDLLCDVAFPSSPEIRDQAWDAIVKLVNGPGPHIH